MAAAPAAPAAAAAPSAFRGAFLGSGLIIAVGYIDPGNWATDLGAGSTFAFAHLFVVLIASLVAMYLQVLCTRLGIVTGRDLAQACRDRYSRRVSLALWASAEVAIAATDLAEVIGAAVALKLLFGLPTSIGVWVTALDVLLLLALAGRRSTVIEVIVGLLVLLVLVCFVVELALVKADAVRVLEGFLPSSVLVTDSDALLLAIGIVGATVMPHNLYLHSYLVKAPAGHGEEDEGASVATAAAAVASAEVVLAVAGPASTPDKVPSRARRSSHTASVSVTAAGESDDGDANDSNSEGGGAGALPHVQRSLLPSPGPAALETAAAAAAAAAASAKEAAQIAATAASVLELELAAERSASPPSSLSSPASTSAAAATAAAASAAAAAESAAARAEALRLLADEQRVVAVAATLRGAALDTAACLFLALFINAAILITSAAAFHDRGFTEVATLEDAYVLIGNVLGSGRAAAIVFGIALLASGQSSTITGTLAGQVVMQGFIEMRVSPTLRRVVTRLLAIVPAAVAASTGGDAAINTLLIVSQVVLSFQLPFAVVPLLQCVTDERTMGGFAVNGCARAFGWAVAVLIGLMNAWLVVAAMLPS